MATTSKIVETTKADDAAKKRLRSPAYPYLNLKTAIERAKMFYDREGRNSAPVTVAATHWGYESKSSGGTQTAAALMSFGLMQDEGTGDKRKLKLTQNGLKILLDTRTDSREREELVKKAALAPKIHQQIWTKWRAGISDENLRHALVFEWEPQFNENSVDGFIREYRDTIAFAKLTESDKVASEDGHSGESEDNGYRPKIGDYIQWESNGMLRMKEPAKLARFSMDGNFAFVEGSPTGIPIGQVIRAEASDAVAQPQIVRASALPTTTMQEDVYSIPEGRIVVQWPASLSPESVEDIKAYLKLLEGKIKRSVTKEKTE